MQVIFVITVPEILHFSTVIEFKINIEERLYLFIYWILREYRNKKKSKQIPNSFSLSLVDPTTIHALPPTLCPEYTFEVLARNFATAEDSSFFRQ